ncbi:MAG: hypothetical protein ACPGUC_11640, partial [Gammaproteobacteria bacterium]
RHFQPGKNSTESISHSWVTAIYGASDPAQSNTLWVGTWGEGLWVRDGEAWQRIGMSRGLPTGKVSDLLVGPTDELWMALYGEGFSRATTGQLLRIGR